MTDEEILEIGVQAGMNPAIMTLDGNFKLLKTFAKLVAEHERERLIDAAMKAAEKAVDVAIALEREACAKIAENRMLDDKNENIKKGYFYAQQSIAQDIRERKDT